MFDAKEFWLDFNCAPGDIVASTALIRDLAWTRRGYRVAYTTNHDSLLAHSPYLVKPDTLKDPLRVTLDYQDASKALKAGEICHFISWFHRNFLAQTGVHVPVMFSKPDLHLPVERIRTPPISGKYWLVLAGGKTDMTVKHWGYDRYREVASRLREKGIATVQTGAADDIHPDAECDLNLVGWGGLPEFVWQVLHCEGVIAPVTCAMHIAAAFDKPAVILAGGREEPYWAGYTNEYNQFGPVARPVKVPHTLLHSVGRLDCCASKGCWKRKVLADAGGGVCTDVVRGRQPLPRCMYDISVDDVINAVVNYYTCGPLVQSAYCKPELLATKIGFKR